MITITVTRAILILLAYMMGGYVMAIIRHLDEILEAMGLDPREEDEE